jgi:hypothetical protein
VFWPHGRLTEIEGKRDNPQKIEKKVSLCLICPGAFTKLIERVSTHPEQRKFHESTWKYFLINYLRACPNNSFASTQSGKIHMRLTDP